MAQLDARWLSWMRVRLVIRRLLIRPPPGQQHSFVEIDHEIISTVILSLPLIQEGQLSFSSERMCTILVKRSVKVWLDKLTALRMTPLFDTAVKPQHKVTYLVGRQNNFESIAFIENTFIHFSWKYICTHKSRFQCTTTSLT